jgi:hypothetical protein
MMTTAPFQSLVCRLRRSTCRVLLCRFMTETRAREGGGGEGRTGGISAGRDEGSIRTGGGTAEGESPHPTVRKSVRSACAALEIGRTAVPEGIADLDRTFTTARFVLR